MQRLLRTDQTPPDGFRYLHAETRFTSHAIDAYSWMDKIRAHREANGLPPITFEEASDQLCKTLPPGNCEHYGETRANEASVSGRLTWQDIATGIKAYVQLLAGGGQPVEKEEADRRAGICAGCYFRVDVQGCGSCVRMADALLGQEWSLRKTNHDGFIAKKACAVCVCPLQSIVHFPMNLLDQADTPQKQAAYPSFCWRKQGGENRLP